MIREEGSGIRELTAQAVVRAGSTFEPEKIRAYERALADETDERACWVLRTILDNAKVAAKNQSPLCDDTGIPHLYLEIGPNSKVDGDFLSDIQAGVRDGLRVLPGRPMAVLGDDFQRIDQSGGLSEDPGDVVAAPIVIKNIDKPGIRLHVLLQGGGPAIRGITRRVFHKHDVETVIEEIVERAAEGVRSLGCSPCTLAIGVGRSQLEAAALMTEAQVYGRYDCQTKFEQAITEKVNEKCNGPMNLGGRTAVLASFAQVGPQRASGVRIVSIRPCCCFEPRKASVELVKE